MKKLVIFLTLFLSSVNICGQKPSLIFARILKDSPDTVWCDVSISKKMEDGTYKVKTKRFHDQMMVSLDQGEYIFQYFVCDRLLFVDRLKLEDEAQTAIMNILLRPEKLADFDFSRVIYSDPILYDFVDHRYSYIEF